MSAQKKTEAEESRLIALVGDKEYRVSTGGKYSRVLETQRDNPDPVSDLFRSLGRWLFGK